MPDALPKGYKYQLALYKLAAEEMFNLPVKSAELHFLRGCVSFELPADFNPEEIAAELQSILPKQMSGNLHAAQLIATAARMRISAKI